MDSNPRIHRIGSVTAGASMIIFGALFLLHMLTDRISYRMIFRFWPVMVIGLGIELLLSVIFPKKHIYDTGAVFLLVIMSLFSFAMAGAELFLTHGFKC